MNKETRNIKNSSRLKKGFVIIAVAEDRALAKDYRDLLLSWDVKSEIIKTPHEIDKEHFDYSIAVKQDRVDKAIEVILSRNPSEYFFNTLFAADDHSSVDRD